MPSSAADRDLPSFPTRRSSDLTLGGVQLASGSATSPAASVTLTFAGPLTEYGSLIDGNYQLAVLAGQVANVGPLDGNGDGAGGDRSEEHTSELQSLRHLVCRLLPPTEIYPLSLHDALPI